MPILLDTNILIEFLRQIPPATAWFRSLDERPVMAAISLVELYAGVRNQREERDILALRHLVTCLPIVQEIAEDAGSFMRHFHKSHGIDMPDAIIAATAEHHGLRLATLNVKHFPMFPKLKRAY
jgi:hypothetical protein